MAQGERESAMGRKRSPLALDPTARISAGLSEPRYTGRPSGEPSIKAGSGSFASLLVGYSVPASRPTRGPFAPPFIRLETCDNSPL